MIVFYKYESKINETTGDQCGCVWGGGEGVGDLKKLQ